MLDAVVRRPTWADRIPARPARERLPCPAVLSCAERPGGRLL